MVDIGYSFDEEEHIIKKGHKQFDDLIAWNFDLQEKLVNKSDFVLLLFSRR